jgi:ATP-dependent exoDNAse (exonuclease V) beta subunit (contains helicase and exonuclease domains)
LANEIGTATHYVLQVMPLEKPTMKSLKELVVSLVQEKRLAPQVAEKINLQKIITFYDSDLGQRILKEAEQVKREQPFSMLLPANRLFADYPTADEILVHGIVDGYIDNDELVLYDFKTDHLSGPAGREKALERYRGQLNVYKEALELATGKKVAETWLILLEPEEQIKL